MHPYVPSIEGYTGVMRVSDPTPVTTTWHADTTHSPRRRPHVAPRRVRSPRTAVTRCSRTVPRLRGPVPRPAGDLDTLRARCTKARSSRSRRRARHRSGDVAHPVVRTHPETGQALTVRQRQLHHALRRLDRSRERAAARVPVRAVGRPEYTWRHRWTGRRRHHLGQPMDAARGRRRVAHGERVLHRVTIAGDIPV